MEIRLVSDAARAGRYVLCSKRYVAQRIDRAESHDPRFGPRRARRTISKGKVMIRSILVPVDGSPFGEQCLPLALSVAARTGASLRLVHVHSIQVPTAADWVVMDAFAFDETQRQEEKSYLAKLSKRLAEFDVHLNAELLEGDVVDALRNSVRVNKVDLV